MYFFTKKVTHVTLTFDLMNLMNMGLVIAKTN